MEMRWIKGKRIYIKLIFRSRQGLAPINTSMHYLRERFLNIWPQFVFFFKILGSFSNEDRNVKENAQTNVRMSKNNRSALCNLVHFFAVLCKTITSKKKTTTTTKNKQTKNQIRTLKEILESYLRKGGKQCYNLTFFVSIAKLLILIKTHFESNKKRKVLVVVEVAHSKTS